MPKNKKAEETLCWKIINSEYKNEKWVKQLIGVAYDEGFEDGRFQTLEKMSKEKCPECGRIGGHSNSCVTVE